MRWEKVAKLIATVVLVAMALLVVYIGMAGPVMAPSVWVLLSSLVIKMLCLAIVVAIFYLIYHIWARRNPTAT